MRQYILNIFSLLSLIFGFNGCSYQVCGVDEDAYNKLSIGDQKQACNIYQEKLLEYERQQEAKRKYSQEMIAKAYALDHVIRVSIVDGEIHYGKNIYKIGSQGFMLANGEAKKVSIYASGKNISEDIWFGYKNGTVYIDFISNVNTNNFYIQQEDNSMYFSAKLNGISRYSWRKDMIQMPNGFYVKKLLVDIRG